MGFQAGWRFALAGCLAWFAVVAAVVLGGRIPAATVWGPMPDSPRFEGGRIAPGSLVPLDPTLVARLLGTPLSRAEPPAAEGRRPSTTDRAAALAAATAGPRADRLVVAHDLTNDGRDAPYVVRSIPFTARTDTRTAGRDDGEPRECAGDGGTVWYAYTPPRDRTLLVSTAGSNYAAAIGIFDDRSLVGCDIDPGGDAKVTFAAKGGRRYLFQVSGPLGGGDLTFSVDALDALRRVGEHDSAWSNGGPSLSGDASRIVFLASDGMRVYDARTDTSRVVVRARDGSAPDGDISHPRFSADGRVIVFSSRATNLVRGDTNREEDVFVHEVDTGRTTRVSLTSAGEQGWPNSPEVPEDADARFAHQAQAISGDGRFVAFTTALQLAGPLPPCSSVGSHLATPYEAGPPRAIVPAGERTYDCRALYVHDQATRSTVRIRTESVGAVNPGAVAMTADARYIAFSADATDTGYRTVFVHDRQTGGFEIVSVAFDGGRANGHSTGADFPRSLALSADGRSVAFTSLASNLVPGDTNAREDVFVRDRLARTTTSLSQQLGPVSEAQTDSWFVTVTMSANGRFVAYDAPVNDTADASSVSACNIDNFLLRAVRVHDLERGTSVVVPVAPDGNRANGASFGPDLASSGDALVLMSSATNLDSSQDAPCPDAKASRGDSAWVFLVDRDTRP